MGSYGNRQPEKRWLQYEGSGIGTLINDSKRTLSNLLTVNYENGTSYLGGVYFIHRGGKKINVLYCDGHVDIQNYLGAELSANWRSL